MSQPAFDPFAPPAADLEPRLVPNDEILASLGSRLRAIIMDGLLLLPFIALRFFLQRADILPAAASKPSEALQMWAFMLPMWLYQWRLIATTGQSIGKRWMKIKIVRSDGGPVDFWSGVGLRVWPLMAVNFALVVATGYVGLQLGLLLKLVPSLGDPMLIFFGKTRRTLHDRIAGTKVIWTPQTAS